MPESNGTILRILIVDDNYWQLLLHQQLLEQSGYLVETAISAKTAWKKIRFSSPDIIILDRLLPDADGVELCQQIKSSAPETQVIMFSGFKIDEADRISGLNAGADDYLVKPVSPRELLARVQAAARVRHLQIKLKNREKQYRLLAENATDLIGRMKISGQMLYVSPSSQELLGYSPEEMVGMPVEHWIHPQDLERVSELGLLVATQPGSASLECRALRKDGTYKWLDITLRTLEGEEEGEMVFAARDVDQRKADESRLRLLSTAVTTTANTVLIFDNEETIQWANPAFTRMTGYTPEEYSGKKLSILQSGRHDEAFFQQLWDTITSGKVWHGEIINRRKNGQEYIEEITITPLEDANGEFTQFIEIKQDITEAKMAQEALMESERRFRNLVENLPDIIFRYDAQRRHVYVSPNVHKVSQRKPAEYLGKTHHELGYTPEKAAYWEEKIQHVLDTGTAHEEEFYYEEGGKEFYLNWRLVPEYDEEGRVTAVLGITRDLSDRKETENQLVRLAALVEQANEVKLVIDKLGQVIYANPYYTTITGQAVTNILGQPIAQLNRLVPTIDLEQIIQNTLATGESWRGQITLEGLNAPRLYLDTDIFAISLFGEPNINVGIVMRDVTERVELLREQAAIANTSSALRQAVTRADMLPVILHEILTTLHAVGVALIQQTPNGRPSIELAVGDKLFKAGHWLSIFEKLQTPLLANEQPYLNNQVVDMLDPAEQNLLGTVRAIIGLPLAVQESQLGILWIGRQTPFQDQEIQLLLAVADIAANALYRAYLFSQVKQQAQELAQRVEERTAALNIANNKLSNALRSRDEFLASMSHELRTPLSAILLRTELLQNNVYGPLNEKQLKSVGVVRSSGQHLLELINDVLDVAKIEAGKLTLDLTTVSIDQICRASLLMVQQLAAPKHINLSLQLADGLESIEADPRRLKQVLVNLLTNAVKFTPDHGQVCLQVEPDTAVQAVAFTISDTGIGIPGDKLSQLFKPFVQLDSSLSRKYEGTGLGLSLVRHLVELHGGGIHITSVVNQGTQITFKLPQKRGGKMKPKQLPHRETSPSILQTSLPRQKKKILLAEDNKHAIEALTEYLADIGYDVAQAHNGVEALDQIRHLQPDLVVMDIQMPDMDGLEAIRRIRHNGAATAQVPILALTALAMPGDRERCLEAGATAYLTKPFSLNELINLLETLTSSSPDFPRKQEGEEK